MTREEWDRRAAEAGIKWVGEGEIDYRRHNLAQCLVCGYAWGVWPHTVTFGSGCPVCAQHGFDPTQPSLVYLLRHDQGPLMKVGVTKIGSGGRLTGHRRQGWEQIATWPVPFGRDALAIEAAVVEWWRASDARACTRDEVPKGDGWTEAVHITAAADEPRTIAYIEELVAEVGGGY